MDEWLDWLLTKQEVTAARWQSILAVATSVIAYLYTGLNWTRTIYHRTMIWFGQRRISRYVARHELMKREAEKQFGWLVPMIEAKMKTFALPTTTQHPTAQDKQVLPLPNCEPLGDPPENGLRWTCGPCNITELRLTESCPKCGARYGIGFTNLSSANHWLCQCGQPVMRRNTRCQACGTDRSQESFTIYRCKQCHIVGTRSALENHSALAPSDSGCARRDYDCMKTAHEPPKVK